MPSLEGLAKDLRDLKKNPSRCSFSEYEVSVHLRTAVLVLGAHRLLTCHYRHMSEPAGADHCCRTRLLTMASLTIEINAVHLTFNAGIVLVLHQAKTLAHHTSPLSGQADCMAKLIAW